MSMAVQTILVLVILEAAVAAPPLAPVIIPAPSPGTMIVVPRQGIWNGPAYRNPLAPLTNVHHNSILGDRGALFKMLFAGAIAATRFAGATSGVASGGSEKPKGCHKIPDPGECRGAFPRYFYNATLDQCDCFLYGGCDDKALIQSTSWLTLSECNNICYPGNPEEGPMCKLLPKLDIQSSTQSNIVEKPDTSHLNSNELLDVLEHFQL